MSRRLTRHLSHHAFQVAESFSIDFPVDSLYKELTIQNMTTGKLWQLWPGRHWPLLPEEEQEFVADLRHAAAQRPEPAPVLDEAGKVCQYDRGDVTLVLNAIRCGISASELQTVAPGAHPRRLVRAYDDLEARRAEAVAAWHSIAERSTLDALSEHGARAALLVPIAVHRILRATDISGPQGMRHTVRAIEATMEGVLAASARVEEVLRGRTTRDRVALGCELYNPYDPGLWGNSYFVPPRVGSLMPVRVSDLLGERVAETVVV